MKRALLIVATLASTAHADSDDGGDAGARRSLALEPANAAWKRPGFRLELAVPYGELVGLRGAPSGKLVGATLRAGLRLDEAWSTVVSFQYALAYHRGTTALGGLRFAGTIDPTWHVTPYISLAVGFGFGGIVETGRDRIDPEPTPDSLETSYTFPDARTPVGSCSGVGAATLVRGEWSYVLSSRFAATVAVEAMGQWTGCIQDTNRVEPDTGEAIVRRQWWPHVGATLAVGVTFR